MNSLKQAFEEAKQLDPRKRGKAFEKVLGLMLELEKIRYVLAYRPTGEEIDGAFWWNDHTFLLEAKWHKDPLPASSIYNFKGKVDGKFSGTFGVFISMSGYSPECVDALVRGKALNILLFDESDIQAIIGIGHSKGENFTTVLTEKLFAAGQTGNVYLSWQKLQEVRRSIESIINSPVFIFCEGKSDVAILNSLLDYVNSKYHLSSDNVRFIARGGTGKLYDIPSLVQIITNRVSETGAILVVIDQQERRLEEFLLKAKRYIPEGWDYHIVVATPDLESWTGIQLASSQRAYKLAKIQTSLGKVDWGVQATKIRELDYLIDFLKRTLPHE